MILGVGRKDTGFEKRDKKERMDGMAWHGRDLALVMHPANVRAKAKAVTEPGVCIRPAHPGGLRWLPSRKPSIPKKPGWASELMVGSQGPIWKGGRVFRRGGGCMLFSEADFEWQAGAWSWVGYWKRGGGVFGARLRG